MFLVRLRCVSPLGLDFWALTKVFRRVFSQLCDPWLGFRYARSDFREEGCVPVYRQRRFHGKFHLHAVFVSQIRRAEVRYRDEQQCSFCFREHCCRLGAPRLAYGAKQEIEEWRQ